MYQRIGEPLITESEIHLFWYNHIFHIHKYFPLVEFTEQYHFLGVLTDCVPGYFIM